MSWLWRNVFLSVSVFGKLLRDARAYTYQATSILFVYLFLFSFSFFFIIGIDRIFTTLFIMLIYNVMEKKGHYCIYPEERVRYRELSKEREGLKYINHTCNIHFKCNLVIRCELLTLLLKPCVCDARIQERKWKLTRESQPTHEKICNIIKRDRIDFYFRQLPLHYITLYHIEEQLALEYHIHFIIILYTFATRLSWQAACKFQKVFER